MENQSNTSNRIERIKDLAKVYFELPDKAIIEKYNELLPIFQIKASATKSHPHENYLVYISRRAIKHFVEERRRELVKNHTSAEAIENICFAIDKIPEIITDFDFCAHTPPRYVYTKDYAHIDKPQLRIVLDIRDHSLEVCSIHFRTKKKDSMEKPAI